MATPLPNKPNIRSQKQKLGAIYTPAYLAEWLLTEVKNLKFSPKVIIDPAAGDGSLLKAGKAIFPLGKTTGFEIDKTSHESLRKSGFSKTKNAQNSLEFNWNLNVKETLVIANPPWGAEMSDKDRTSYREIFETARGHFDTYDLFVEKILSELPNGGLAAIFLPDSILLPQHEKTRKYIMHNSEIQLLVRIGEGAFHGVYMGTVVLILRKRKCRPGHKVRCAKISREDLLNIDRLANQMQLLVKRKAHLIPQERFSSDRHFSWTLQIRENEFNGADPKRLTAKVISNSSNQAWDEWFTSSRGLEIGKNGLLLQCKYCLHLRTIPTRETLNECDICGSKKNPWNEVSVISTFPGANNTFVPLLAGEDLRRYSYSVRKWIDPAFESLDYKNELLNTERLLVRKTGIGLHSSWCPGGIATTQTIYHFKKRQSAPEYALRYAEGMLGSRVINAIHLARSGETEWRSHPYVTQRTIKSLPLPTYSPGSKNERLAVRIAEIAQQFHSSEMAGESDCEIEYLAAQILGGGKPLVQWAIHFLGSVTGSTHVKNLHSTFIQKNWKQVA